MQRVFIPSRSSCVPSPSSINIFEACGIILIPTPSAFIPDSASQIFTLTPFFLRAKAVTSPPIPAPEITTLVTLCPSDLHQSMCHGDWYSTVLKPWLFHSTMPPIKCLTSVKPN